MRPGRGFEILAALGIVGTAIELAVDRHWDTAVQLIPWVAVVAIAVALGLVRRGDGRARRIGRRLALLVAFTALLGIFEHVKANVDAGFLDATYGATWGDRTALSRWWIAASGGVGPSPLLAPGILAQAALCVLFADRSRAVGGVATGEDSAILGDARDLRGRSARVLGGHPTVHR